MKTSQWLMLSLITLAISAIPPNASGQLLISNHANDTINEYNFDGTPVGSGTFTSSGLDAPYGIAISESNVFVANSLSNTISEYTLSGDLINASLVSSGLSYPQFIAISGDDLFVVDNQHNRVGEYTTSGALVNACLLYTSPSPRD